MGSYWQFNKLSRLILHYVLNFSREGDIVDNYQKNLGLDVKIIYSTVFAHNCVMISLTKLVTDAFNIL